MYPRFQGNQYSHWIILVKYSTQNDELNTQTFPFKVFTANTVICHL